MANKLIPKAKLTPKRRHFARLVASGQSQADAYREAFDCKPGSLSQTHVESASKLARDPLVSTTIRQLIDRRDRAERDRGLGKRDLVISLLSEAIENDDFGVNRLKALSLMADVPPPPLFRRRGAGELYILIRSNNSQF